MAADNHEEPLDVCDANGMPLGLSKTRHEVHHSGRWHRTVHIWVVNHAKQLLLQKRSPAKEAHPGFWDVSAAGHITAGDSSILAAIRELHEELGLVAVESDLQFLFHIRQWFDDPENSFFDREIADVYLLRSEEGTNDFKFDPEEVAAVRWIDAETLRWEIKEKAGAFVPHGEEYEKVLGIIG